MESANFFAFSCAKSKASLDKSIAETCVVGKMDFKANAIQPLPVQRSRITFGFFTEARTQSTSSSVSGRGIKARESHEIVKPKKLVSPNKYWKGTCWSKPLTKLRTNYKSDSDKRSCCFNKSSVGVHFIRLQIIWVHMDFNSLGENMASRRSKKYFLLALSVFSETNIILCVA